MIILGVDPGTDRAGFGLIEKNGQRIRFIEAGILKTGKERGADALFAIKRELDELIVKHNPAILGTEKLFFMKNQTTGISIAEARGVILLSAREHGVLIREFAPTEVKLAITGFGAADKKSVLKMVKLILGAPELDILDDASDALAIAIAAAQNDVSAQAHNGNS